jgi:hypothetical protein
MVYIYIFFFAILKVMVYDGCENDRWCGNCGWWVEVHSRSY